ncbi:hypothetical protein HMPREF9440_02145 [Sutterella parvirubra YIT 11816]|uniref:Uncharacterized protein n=1 Tax=Sutterella parvirubra YIT 11816 TaxID=762967 RepID=H3KHA1_9BURK|nr:hypothetical protein HMPREF9440_02145 [Sutterella parvirubra YIT 11816]
MSERLLGLEMVERRNAEGRADGMTPVGRAPGGRFLNRRHCTKAPKVPRLRGAPRLAVRLHEKRCPERMPRKVVKTAEAR